MPTPSARAPRASWRPRTFPRSARLEELRRLAFSNIGQCFDAQGDLLPLAEMTAEARACVASVKVVTRQAPAGEGAMVTVADLKLWDKMRALEFAGDLLGLLKKQVEHSGEIDLVARLRAVRAIT